MFNKTKNLHEALKLQTQETRSTLASHTSRLNMIDSLLRNLSTQIVSPSSTIMVGLLDRIEALETRILQLESEKAERDARVKPARSRKPKQDTEQKSTEAVGPILTSDETNF